MKIIKKEISLEPFKSRMPSVIKADYEGETYEFVGDEFYYPPYNNYGMFPRDIMYNGEKLTFSELTNRFHFIDEYKRILSTPHCGRTYTSMTDYYECELAASRYTYEECVKMDADYLKYDGESFYNYAIQNYFPRYDIPTHLQDAWDCQFLYLGDVIRCIGKLQNYSDNSQNDECAALKFEELGGVNFLTQLKNWVKELNCKIEYPTSNDDKCGYGSYIDIPIIITNTITNSGDYSIFAEDWVPGHDYGSGATVIYDNDVYSLLSECQGYDIDDYKNIVFNANCWKNLTLTRDPNEENYRNKTFSYHTDGRLILDPTNEKMRSVYTLNTNDNLGYYILNNVIIAPYISSYIIYNGNVYQVYEEKEGLNPWVSVNSKRYVATYDNGKYVFTILGEDYNINENGILVNYIGQTYLVDDFEQAQHIDSYATVNYEILYIKDYEILNTEKLGEKLSDHPTDDPLVHGYYVDESTLYVYTPYDVYNASIISGQTESKLSSLEAIGGYLYDNLGNKMPGMLETSEIAQDAWLDIPYKVGTTAHLSQNEDGTYWGDYLHTIKVHQNGKSTSLTSDITLRDVITDLKVDEEQPIYCTIEYYIGCELTSDRAFIGGGVHYKDIITLKPSICQYFVSQTECINLNYYEFEYETIKYVHNDYNNHPLEVRKSYFEVNITPDENLPYSIDMMDSPIIKEEYKIGISTPEKIQSDIYINRGVARAFDYHLKLLEVKSFEALENYGNSWFKLSQQ